MKKFLAKACKKAVERTIKINANSTTSYFCYQPKAPEMLKKFSKVNHAK